VDEREREIRPGEHREPDHSRSREAAKAVPAGAAIPPEAPMGAKAVPARAASPAKRPIVAVVERSERSIPA
jgi:hypothetical protein